MITVSTELAAAIQADRRTPLVRVMVDWDNDGFGPAASVDDLTGKQGHVAISRTIVTDLPDPVRIVEGTAAATATVELVEGDPSDVDMHAARYFTRGSDSPLGGKERVNRACTVDIGFITEAGPQYVRRLTGLTRNLSTSGRNRTSSLSMLDNRARLRNTVLLVPTNGVEAGCSATWLITQALYANGIGAGPLPRSTGLITWVPCYGSINEVRHDGLPTWLVQFRAPSATAPLGFVAPRFRPGPFVLAADPYATSANDFAQMFLNSTPPIDVSWSGQRGRVEAWVLGVASPPAALDAYGRTHFRLSVDSGQITVRAGITLDGHLFLATYDQADAVLHTYSSTTVVPADVAWHFIGIAWDVALQKVVFRLDGITETATTAFAPGEVPVNPDEMGLRSSSPISDIMVHDIDVTQPWIVEMPIVIGAVLDTSGLEMVACFEDRPREGWELAGELAAAEQAVAYFDEPGIFRYRTRDRLADQAGQSVQRVLSTADASLLEADIDDGIDQVRNILQVSYNAVELTQLTLIYEDTVQRIVGPGAVLEFTVSFSNPVIVLQYPATTVSVEFHAANPHGPSGGTSFFDPYLVITTSSDFMGDAGVVDAYTPSVHLLVTSWSPKAATVRISNNTPVMIYVAAVGLRGRAAIISSGIVVEARDEASIALYGPQPLQLSTPQWVQDGELAQRQAVTVLGDVADPHPSVRGLRVVGDPRLQLGDRVRLADPEGMQLDGEFWLSEIGDDVSDAGAYTQQISARAATTVMLWDQGQWGINTWG